MREEIEKERKRNDDPGVEGEMKRDRDRIGDAERAQGADLGADFGQRTLQDENEPLPESEAENHGEDQDDRHFHDRPAQILEMFEERLGGFALGRIAKREDIAQLHSLGKNVAARDQPGPEAEGVGVADLALGDHLAQDVGAEFAAIENRFRRVVLRAAGMLLHRLGEEEVAMFVGHPGRSKEIA